MQPSVFFAISGDVFKQLGNLYAAWVIGKKIYVSVSGFMNCLSVKAHDLVNKVYTVKALYDEVEETMITT